MKREIVYILILLAILLGGYLSKTMFIESQWIETKNNYKEIDKVKGEFLRDSLIQKSIDNIKLAYETNKRGKSEEVQVNSEIIAIFERMFKEAKIKLGKDNISSGVESKEGSISYFNISLHFTSEYKKIIDFLNLVYSNESFISVERLHLKNFMNSSDDEDSEKKEKVNNSRLVEVDLDLNVIKMK